MFFQQGALNVPQIPWFSSLFYFQFSKQTSQKHWYLQCFDKTACKKSTMFSSNLFAIFQRKVVTPKAGSRLFGPQNAVNYGVLWTYHAFTCRKRPPPQLKLTVLVPPERHALLHLRCGRISVFSGPTIIYLQYWNRIDHIRADLGVPWF